MLWGFGGLTFGLTMRYLGMSLGMAMVLGYCAAFGTLIPPIYHGEFFSNVLPTHSGQVIVLGIADLHGGHRVRGQGRHVEGTRDVGGAEDGGHPRIQSEEGRAGGHLFGSDERLLFLWAGRGAPIKALALQHGTSTLWQGLPVLVVLLVGGFTTNFVWCLILNIRNRTWLSILQCGDPQSPSGARRGAHHRNRYRRSRRRNGGSAARARRRTGARADVEQLLLRALAGTTWYFQFFFYTMGETQMGKYKFSSWTLHMASIIIFSSLWGIALHEWRGASVRTKMWLTVSLLVLVRRRWWWATAIT